MIASSWDCADWYRSKYALSLLPPGMNLKILRAPCRSEWPGSSSVMVLRSSARLPATLACAPGPLPCVPFRAAAGRSSIRLETLLDSAISRWPIVVIEATFWPNSGERGSTVIRSSTNAFALACSCWCIVGSIGSMPSACFSSTTGTAAGGASTRSVLVVLTVVAGGANGVLRFSGSDIGFPPRAVRLTVRRRRTAAPLYGATPPAHGRGSRRVVHRSGREPHGDRPDIYGRPWDPHQQNRSDRT